MSFLHLIRRSLTHYRGLNLAVMLGVALTSAILSGALTVGDSVKESLRRDSAARISQAGPALTGGERFFSQDLAARLLAAPNPPKVLAPLLQLHGTVTVQGGGRRLNQVQIVGVTPEFWKLGNDSAVPEAITAKGKDWFAVNDAAARRLEVTPGDRIVVRLEKPGALSRDAPLSGESEQTVPLAGAIDAIVDSTHFGRYSLRAEQVPAATVFVPLEKLQLLVEKEGRANVLLADAGTDRAAFLNNVANLWNLADAELQLTAAGPGDALRQLSTGRVFLDSATVSAATAVTGEGGDGVLTYLVNAMRHGDRMTPYSMVAATGSETNGILPKDLGPNEIVVTDWLAEDLGLSTGDAIRLEYFVVDAGRKLREESSEFTVRGIVPMAHPEVNRSWTPDFPGVLEVDSMDQWEPGIPIDNDRIRKKDDDYWAEYKATPKAYIGLDTGRRLWGNRFGDTTALRFPAAKLDAAAFESGLKSRIGLTELGWQVRDLPAEAASAVGDSFDFGQLFAYMSFFLIVAALVLTGLVFVFGIEQRAGQIGLLMAIGYPRSTVRWLFLGEAVLLSVAGAAIGLLGGWIYTKLALLGMSGAWRAAASGIEFVYHIRPVSLALAFGITVTMALLVVWFSSKLVTRVQPGHLIAGGSAISEDSGQASARQVRLGKSGWTGVLSLLAGIGCLLAPKEPGTMAEQGLFFGAGFLLTLAGVCGCALLLRRMERPGRALTSLASLGRQYSVRRKGRSLAVIGLMAAGVFMVTAINSFRLEGQRGAVRRGSGTGGFAHAGSTTLPIYEDLNSAQGREKYGLAASGDDVAWSIVQFRVSDGDDASCLNLNRAQRPRLMGVNPAKLADLGAFSFAKSLGGDGWNALTQKIDSPEGAMPVFPGVIDLNTATYALKRGLGDIVEYESAGGEKFGVKLVGLLETSILQGSIIIAEDAFVGRFPNAGGYRFFLLDSANQEVAESAAEKLTNVLGDRGLELLPAWRRLDEFNAVQNTYLSIFSTLGGLGLLLGTVGLAVVVGRNVLERRGQLALMQALGFTRRALSRMVLDEHWFLHVLGVLLGIAAAAVAVLPKILSQASDLPAGLLIGINAATLIGGLVFCAVAARLVLRGSLIDSLRSE